MGKCSLPPYGYFERGDAAIVNAALLPQQNRAIRKQQAAVSRHLNGSFPMQEERAVFDVW